MQYAALHQADRHPVLWNPVMAATMDFADEHLPGVEFDCPHPGTPMGGRPTPVGIVKDRS
jgi:hypothetical protein